MFMGFLADKYGRLKCSIIASVCLIITLTLNEILQSTYLDLDTQAKYVSYCVIQMVIGALSRGLYCISYTLLIEFSTAKHSTRLTNMFMYSFVLGQIVLLSLSYTLRNWHTFNWIVTLFVIFVTVAYCIALSESPRFLVDNKRYGKAADVFVRMAKLNGKKNVNWVKTEFVEAKIENMVISNEPIQNLSYQKESAKQSFDEMAGKLFWPLPNLVKTTMFVYIWTSLNLVYFGVSLGKKESFIFMLKIIKIDNLIRCKKALQVWIRNSTLISSF